MAASLTPLQVAELILLRAELHKIQESLDTLNASSRDVAEYALLRKGVPSLRRVAARLELERFREATTTQWLHSAEPEPCPGGPVSPQCEEVHLQVSPVTPEMPRSSPSAIACTPSPRADLGEKRGSESETSGGPSKARKVADPRV